MLSVQVLLWTTCLVSSCAGSSEAVRAEDTQFLLRETGNLKQTVGVLNTQDFLPGAVDLRGGNLHLEWEALLLARLKEAVVTPALTQRRPVLTLASLLPVTTGVPAPYSGVKALVKA
eukprot:jgi/Astpho2/8424/Aster-07612